MYTAMSARRLFVEPASRICTLERLLAAQFPELNSLDCSKAALIV